MINFFKGIVVGFGGITPGLSGSVLLVIFGLYQKTINAMGTLFKDFKNNLKFLVPLFLGFGVGVVAFSKLVEFLLANYEMYTRYTFLGLIIGTIPLFYKEVKKNGFKKRYYIVIAISAIVGFSLFLFNKNLFPIVTNPNLFQSSILGVAIAGSSIVPGVDSSAILSALGLYELEVSAFANFDLSILIPAGFGLAISALVISFIMNKLITKHYTTTFSVIFGLFLSVTPSVLELSCLIQGTSISFAVNSNCVLGNNSQTVIALCLTVVGFIVSYFLGDIKGNVEKVKKITSKIKSK